MLPTAKSFETQIGSLVEHCLNMLIKKIEHEDVLIDDDLRKHIEETYNDMVTSASYTLYKSNNFGGKTTSKNVSKSKTKKNIQNKITWYQHPQDENYSYTDDVVNEDGYYFVRDNKNQKIIATINDSGLSHLTMNDVKILISHHLKYDDVSF